MILLLREMKKSTNARYKTKKEGHYTMSFCLFSKIEKTTFIAAQISISGCLILVESNIN